MLGGVPRAAYSGASPHPLTHRQKGRSSAAPLLCKAGMPLQRRKGWECHEQTVRHLPDDFHNQRQVQRAILSAAGGGRRPQSQRRRPRFLRLRRNPVRYKDDDGVLRDRGRPGTQRRALSQSGLSAGVRNGPISDFHRPPGGCIAAGTVYCAQWPAAGP